MPYDYQHELNLIKQTFDVDFVGVAMPSDLIVQNDIKWQFVSGETNERYKRIHLQRGKGIAGIVMKSGRHWMERDISESAMYDNLFNFPIVKFEKLTSFIAVPLWKYNIVSAVLMLGNRDGKALDMTIEKDLERYLKPGFGPFYSKDVINHEHSAH